MEKAKGEVAQQGFWFVISCLSAFSLLVLRPFNSTLTSLSPSSSFGQDVPHQDEQGVNVEEFWYGLGDTEGWLDASEGRRRKDGRV